MLGSQAFAQNLKLPSGEEVIGPASDKTVKLVTGEIVTFSNTCIVGTNTYTGIPQVSTDTITLTGTISGTGGISKSATDTLVLTGSATIEGETIPLALEPHIVIFIDYISFPRKEPTRTKGIRDWIIISPNLFLKPPNP